MRAGLPRHVDRDFRAGQPVANAALVDASSGVCALANVAVDLVIDVFGDLA